MKRSLVYAIAFFLLLLYIPITTSSRHISHSNSRHGHSKHEVANMRRPMQVAGSRLPDCSHACGSCSPCKLVMVSLVCASLAEAESCPMAYKCMCHNKSYPVP
ncbi:protein EPIDERMAL PATTERNING FACTOR 1 [Vicia villosa]|uniref:protein EPIDERMAL PATTERNING FACTOR 1 n=1 Tax=Vicia villosa TaxID=3911 RepID=UPI00273C15F1|nr:protein EPIDERMAL PATTERNING FACTOR 1 [Vicia villosa]